MVIQIDLRLGANEPVPQVAASNQPTNSVFNGNSLSRARARLKNQPLKPSVDYCPEQNEYRNGECQRN